MLMVKDRVLEEQGCCHFLCGVELYPIPCPKLDAVYEARFRHVCRYQHGAMRGLPSAAGLFV